MQSFTTYYHQEQNEGRVTLAIKVAPNDNNAISTVTVGVAFCSPKDQFVKRIGRTIAFARAKNLAPYRSFVFNCDNKLTKSQIQQKAKEAFEGWVDFQTKTSKKFIPSWALTN